MSNYPPYPQPLLDANQRVSRPWQLFFSNLVAGAGAAAPASASFVLTSANTNLPNSAVLTTSSTISVNTATSGQVRFDYRGAFLQLTTTVLTDTQIRALTAPIAIVPAPGVGFRTALVQCDLWGDFTGGGYGNIDPVNGAWFVLQLGGIDYSAFLADDPTLASPLTNFSNFFATTGQTHAVLVPWQPPTDVSQIGWGGLAYGEPLAGTLPNAPLNALITNAPGNLTGGNAANTLTCRTLHLSYPVP